MLGCGSAEGLLHGAVHGAVLGIELAGEGPCEFF